MDFQEFVAATLHVHQLEEYDTVKWQMRSRDAFDKFDFDKDGYITPEELRMVCISCNHYWVFFEIFSQLCFGCINVFAF